MSKKICMFTGHRILPFDGYDELKARLFKTLESLYSDGVGTFIAGGALGFDTLAASMVLGLKETYPDIKLHLILPCKNQDKRWAAKKRESYAKILERADDITYVAELYIPGCMHARNRKMVECADVCVAYLNRDSGGTAYTVNLAKEKGIEIINLAE